MLVKVPPFHRLSLPFRLTTALTVPILRLPQSHARASAIRGLPPQLVAPYETLTDLLHRLEPVQWETFDIVGARGNIRWIPAAFALFLIALVAEALSRVTVGADGDSEYGRQRPTDKRLEKSIEAEVQRQPPATELRLQLELEKYLRESENVVASRESSITFTVIAWALFTFALEAFNRTPDLPLQP